MKWAHLPVAGGLYDQHPLLLQRWRYIFSERAKLEEKKRRKEELNNKKPRPSSAGRMARGRRR